MPREKKYIQKQNTAGRKLNEKVCQSFVLYWTAPTPLQHPQTVYHVRLHLGGKLIFGARQAESFILHQGRTSLTARGGSHAHRVDRRHGAPPATHNGIDAEEGEGPRGRGTQGVKMGPDSGISWGRSEHLALPVLTSPPISCQSVAAAQNKTNCFTFF